MNELPPKLLTWKSGRQGLFGPTIPRGIFVSAFGNLQYVIRRDPDLRYRLGAHADLPTGKQRGFFKLRFPTLASAQAAAERHLSSLIAAEKEIEHALKQEPDVTSFGSHSDARGR